MQAEPQVYLRDAACWRTACCLFTYWYILHLTSHHAFHQTHCSTSPTRFSFYRVVQILFDVSTGRVAHLWYDLGCRSHRKERKRGWTIGKISLVHMPTPCCIWEWKSLNCHHRLCHSQWRAEFDLNRGKMLKCLVFLGCALLATAIHR